MDKDKFYIVARDSEHWHAMWKWLGQHPYNAGLSEPTLAPCSDTGECWQYMGTVDGFDEFRHRHHPKRRERVYVRRPLPTNPLTGEVA